MYKMIYSGFQGKLGTQNAHGSNSGSCGSLRMQNTHEELEIHVVYIVAPTAHWGHRKPATTSIYLWFTQWLLLLTGDTELTKC